MSKQTVIFNKLEEYNANDCSQPHITIGKDGEICILEFDKKHSRYYGQIYADGYHESITFKAPELSYCFTSIQPVDQENFLAVSPRCHTTQEHNAFIYNIEGNKIKSFLLGDGIENVSVTNHSTILVSYFDEGVFGNGFGNGGLVEFDMQGHILWNWNSNKAGSHLEILDCYALNVVSSSRVYFYYYKYFYLIELNLQTKEYIIYKVPIQRMANFAINNQYIFSTAGHSQNHFLLMERKGSNIEKEKSIIVIDKEGQILSPKNSQVYMRGSKIILLNKNLYYGDINTLNFY